MPDQISFPQSSNVPIVGQPVRIDSIAIAVGFACKDCQQPLMIALVNMNEVGQGTVTATCPKCNSTWGFGPGTGMHVNVMKIVPPLGSGRN